MWHTSFSTDSELSSTGDYVSDGYIWSKVKGGRDEFFRDVADYFAIVSKSGENMRFVSKSNAKRVFTAGGVRFVLPDKDNKVTSGKFTIMLGNPRNSIETEDGRQESGWFMKRLYGKEDD